MENKVKQFQYFQEIFLLADISLSIVLGISYLTLQYKNEFCHSKTQLEVSYYCQASIDHQADKADQKKEFVITIFNFEDETFMVHVASISLDQDIYFFCKAQLVLLFTVKIFIVIFSKYIDFIDIFFPELIVKLLKYTKMKIQPIDLIDDQ